MTGARSVLTRVVVVAACIWLVMLVAPGPGWARLLLAVLLGPALAAGLRWVNQHRKQGPRPLLDAARWLLWSEQRFKIALLGGLAAVMVLGLGYGVRTTLDVQQAKYEADLAEYEAAEKASQSPTAEPGEGSPSAGASEPSAEATGQDKAKATAAARGFATSWLSAHAQKSSGRWVNAMRPYAADELVPLLSYTQASEVPKAKLRTVSLTLDGDDGTAKAVLTDRSTVSMDLTRTREGWRVSSYAPAAAPKAKKSAEDHEWGDDAKLRAEARRGAPAVKVATTLADRIVQHRSSPKTRWLERIKPYLSTSGQQQMRQQERPTSIGFATVTGTARVVVGEVDMGERYVSVAVPTNAGHFLFLVERTEQGWKVASISKMPGTSSSKAKGGDGVAA